MTTCLIAFVVAFLVAVVATILIRRVALRFGIVDKPDRFRKLHPRKMPRLGGVAIYVAFVAPIVLLLFFRENLVARTLFNSNRSAPPCID